MSRLDDFAFFCQQHSGNTLSDLLTMAGYKDPAQRASLKSQMRRAMAPPDGSPGVGTHRHLAQQKVIIPGPDDRGDWTEGLERARANNLPVVLESNAFSTLRAADKSNLTTRYREHVEIAQTTNITGRKGMAVNDALVIGINEYERIKDHVEALKMLITEKDTKIIQLLDEVDFLREMVRKLGGQGIVPARPMAAAAE